MDNISENPNNRPGYGIVHDSGIDQVITKQPSSRCFGTRRVMVQEIDRIIRRMEVSSCGRNPIKSSLCMASGGTCITCLATGFLLAKESGITASCLASVAGPASAASFSGCYITVIASLCCHAYINISQPGLIVLRQLRDQFNQRPEWLNYNDQTPQVQALMDAIKRVSFRKFPQDLIEKEVDRDHLTQNLNIICLGSAHKDFFNQFIKLIPEQCRFRYEYALFYLDRIESSMSSLTSTLEKLKSCMNSPEFNIDESAKLLDEGHSKHPSPGCTPDVPEMPVEPGIKLEYARQCIGNILSVAELQVAMILGFCAASTNHMLTFQCVADKAYLKNAQVYFERINDLDKSAKFTRSVADSAKEQQTSEERIPDDGPVPQSIDSPNSDQQLEQFKKVYNDFQALKSIAGSLIDLLKTLEKKSFFSKPESAAQSVGV